MFLSVTFLEEEYYKNAKFIHWFKIKKEKKIWSLKFWSLKPNIALKLYNFAVVFILEIKTNKLNFLSQYKNMVSHLHVNKLILFSE